jgi:ArsR family transcriptional regulator
MATLAQPIDEYQWVVYHRRMALRTVPVLRERGTCCALPAVDQDWADRTSILMKALGDPTRLTMVAALWKAQQPICICDFTADLGLSQSTISHHMARLKEAGLVEADRQGIWMYYTLRKGLPAPTQKLLRQLLG